MEKDTAGSASADNGSANSENQNQNEQTESSQPRMVRYDSYKRVSDDMHKFKGQVRDFEAKFNELENQRLAEKEEYKQLWEKEKADKEKWKVEAEKGKSLFINTQKYNTVKRYALQAGIRDEALEDLELIPLDGVEVETTDSGRYAVTGAQELVEGLKTKRPFWFKKDEAPKINSGGGSVRPDVAKDLSPEDVVKAERQWKMGKISHADYEKVYTDFLSQRKT